MNGLHLIGDLYDCQCSAQLLEHAAALEAICVHEAKRAGMHVVGTQFYQFEPIGVTGAVLLAESHLAIHTWPEKGCVTLDVYVCNHHEDNRSKAEQLFKRVCDRLQPNRVSSKPVERGAIA